jgi:hypothetical protein
VPVGKVFAAGNVPSNQNDYSLALREAVAREDRRGTFVGLMTSRIGMSSSGHDDLPETLSPEQPFNELRSGQAEVLGHVSQGPASVPTRSAAWCGMVM